MFSHLTLYHIHVYMYIYIFFFGGGGCCCCMLTFILLNWSQVMFMSFKFIVWLDDELLSTATEVLSCKLVRTSLTDSAVEPVSLLA